MGSQASVQRGPELLVPQTPIELSQTFVSQLEDSKNNDYIQRQYADKFLEGKVKNRLLELEQNTLKEFDRTLKQSLQSADESFKKDNLVSTASIISKIDAFQSQLNDVQEMDAHKKLKLSEGSLSDSRRQVAECLLRNKEKPLDCYDEIQKFKQEAAKYN